MHRYIPRLNCATGDAADPVRGGSVRRGGIFYPCGHAGIAGTVPVRGRDLQASALSPAPTKAKGKSANTETAGTGRYGDYTTAPWQIRGGI